MSHNRIQLATHGAHACGCIFILLCVLHVAINIRIRKSYNEGKAQKEMKVSRRGLPQSLFSAHNYNDCGAVVRSSIIKKSVCLPTTIVRGK